MKKIIKAGLLLIIFYPIISALYSFSFSPPLGRTGSPGDGEDCRSCHFSEGLEKEMLFEVISTSIPESGYIPNEEYEITISGIAVPGGTKYGFSMTSENSANEKVGEFEEGDILNTQSFSSFIGHAPASEESDPTWTFKWTAPDFGTGEVSFYASFVISTEGFSTARVKFSELTIQENISVSSHKVIEQKVDLFINQNQLRIISEEEMFMKKLQIINNLGQFVKAFNFSQSFKNNSVDISDLRSGLYLISLETEIGIITKKVMK